MARSSEALVALCVWCGQANFLQRVGTREASPPLEIILQVPFLYYPASFCFQFLIHIILKRSNSFFPLEWILGSIVVRENVMRIVCGSNLGQSSSTWRKRRFLWWHCAPSWAALLHFFQLVAIAWEYFPDSSRRVTRLFINYPAFTSFTLFTSSFLDVSFMEL